MTTDITCKFFRHMEVFVMNFKCVVRYSLVQTFGTAEHVYYCNAGDLLTWTANIKSITDQGIEYLMTIFKNGIVTILISLGISLFSI